MYTRHIQCIFFIYFFLMGCSPVTPTNFPPLPTAARASEEVNIEQVTFTPELTAEAVTTPPPPLLIRWKILSYDCINERATGAIISLEVSGGIPSDLPDGIPGSEPGTDPRYSYSPKLPIYAKPDQFLSITVFSGTDDGQPAGTIAFTVPSANDKSEFNCEEVDTGNRLLPSPPPTENPPPTDEPPGTEEPVCYNSKGKIIPCKKE